MNKVTLFSNGMGFFSKKFKLGGETSVSIPVKTDHLADMAASLRAFAPVKFNFLKPPTFSPQNVDDTTIDLKEGDVLVSLFNQVVGSKIELRRGLTSQPEAVTIVGTISKKKEVDKQVVTTDFLVYRDDAGRINSGLPVSEITSFAFLDPTVQAEVDKALRTRYGNIKKTSSLVEMSFQSEKEAEGVLNYAIPVAAWKMCYSISQSSSGLSLDASAIVDNCTEEDWKDTQVSVVTGNPVSFMTDLAQIVRPVRDTVNLVEKKALTAVRASAGVAMAKRGRGPAAAPMMAFAASANALESVGGAGAMDYEGADMGGAAYAPMESAEVGDFSVFTSQQPIDLASMKSAIVPMFGMKLKESSLVLFYKEENHATRPFRTIQFKNESSFSLGRGKVSIYIDDILSGEAVLESAKPGETRMLPHCLENSVNVHKDDAVHSNSLKSLKISDGAVLEEQSISLKTTYNVTNFGNQSFDWLVIEQPTWNPKDSSAVYSVNVEGAKVERTETGVRVSVPLDANDTMRVVVSESYASASRYSFDNSSFTRFTQSHRDLLSNPTIKRCHEISAEIGKLQEQVRRNSAEIADLDAECESLRKNLQALGSTANSKSGDWANALDTTTSTIKKKKQENATLNVKIADLNRDLKAALLTVEFEA